MTPILAERKHENFTTDGTPMDTDGFLIRVGPCPCVVIFRGVVMAPEMAPGDDENAFASFRVFRGLSPPEEKAGLTGQNTHLRELTRKNAPVEWILILTGRLWPLNIGLIKQL